MTCSKFSDFGTPRSKCRAFGTPQPYWDPSRATTRACTRDDPSRSRRTTQAGRARRHSAPLRLATRRERGHSWRKPQVSRQPERPAPRSSPPPGQPLALFPFFFFYLFLFLLSFLFFFERHNGPASAAPCQEGHFWKRSETKKRILRVAQKTQIRAALQELLESLPDRMWKETMRSKCA